MLCLRKMVLLGMLVFLLGCLAVPEGQAEEKSSGKKVCGEETAFISELYVPRGPTLFAVTPLRAGLLHGPEVKIWGSPEEIIGLFASERAQCAVLPVTLGARMHQKGIPLLLLGVFQWNLFSVLSSPEESGEKLEDLRGSTLYLPFGRGTTADLLIRASLRRAGLVPEVNVTMLYAPPQEIVALLKAGRAPYGVLPEPFASLALLETDVRECFPLVTLWRQVQDGEEHLPVTGLFVSRAAFDCAPRDFREMERHFLLSLEWAQQHPQHTLGFLREDLPLSPKALSRGIGRMNFTYVPGARARKTMERFYAFLCSQDSRNCPGVPEKEFYLP